MSRESSQSGRSLFGPFDPGWLYLVAGLGLLVAAMLIPAQQDLADARWRRDAALQLEQHRLERLERYRAYRDALVRGDAALTQSLAASQLGLVPADGQPLATAPSVRSASIFHELEPPALEIETPEQRRSMLQRLVTGRETRLWVVAAAAICILFGTLPRPGRDGAPDDRVE